MKRLLLGIGCLLLTGMALAADRPAREQAEASMLVDGMLGVTPEGTVLAYSLDRQEKLPPEVVQIIAKTVPRWTFDPVRVDGKPVAAKSRMHLRVVASPNGEGGYQIAVRSAYFGERSTSIKLRRQRAIPRYPAAAIHHRIEGAVYLWLRLDRKGRVAGAAVQQVNLGAVGRPGVLKEYREVFAQSALKAAPTWSYTAAAPTDPEYRLVRVPVVYSMTTARGGTPPNDYGQWKAYVPGPTKPIPWSNHDDDKLLTQGGDALPGEGIYGPSTLSLRTPLDRG